jgi:hypothetical protein
VIARAAATAGSLRATPLALAELAIDREQQLTEVFLTYCRARTRAATGPMPPEIAALLGELCKDLPSAVRASGGIGLLYPQAASTIHDHLSARLNTQI